MNDFENRKVLITGGAGYVGSRLAEKLLVLGYGVIVYDLCIYGNEVLAEHPNLTIVQADIRDSEAFRRSIEGCDYVIHLACISNDPSFELNPSLGKSINLDCFEPLVRVAKSAGVKRFIYASSSSVYGLKDHANVIESDSLEPLTDYSKFKAQCESILSSYGSDSFEVVTIRPATVCGYSRRLRLDVIVNILTNHAFFNRKIIVLGGSQLRPNIHIDDMVSAYVQLLKADSRVVNGEIFNCGFENKSVSEIATVVRTVVGSDVQIETAITKDLRSYHISSEKIRNTLGFSPAFCIEDAVRGLVDSFERREFVDTFNDPRFHNIKKMQELRFE